MTWTPPCSSLKEQLLPGSFSSGLSHVLNTPEGTLPPYSGLSVTCGPQNGVFQGHPIIHIHQEWTFARNLSAFLWLTCPLFHPIAEAFKYVSLSDKFLNISEQGMNFFRVPL